MRIPLLKKRIKGLVKVEHGVGILFTTFATSSLPITWMIWDALLSIKLYFHQKFFPDHMLRVGRLALAVCVFLKFINPIIGGFAFVCDGLVSIVGYRLKRETVDDIEDVGRLGRIGWGFVLMFPALIPSLI